MGHLSGPATFEPFHRTIGTLAPAGEFLGDHRSRYRSTALAATAVSCLSQASAFAWLIVSPGHTSAWARMSYRLRLLETDEGWSVSCLDLPGCHSQGDSRDEALLNIREAIQLWLEVEAEEAGVKTAEVVEITV